MLNDSFQLTDKKFTRFNNILGWAVFIFSAWVYWSTIEPTASFWDCSEFISVDYKLQIPHPPGAPFLQLIAHLISLLTFGNVHNVAPFINRLSATCSALTIMFLFWTITWFAKKIVTKKSEFTVDKMYAVLGAGLIGSLTFTFTDSFWFSAVEGEVYAMSSCFTALVFWCITKWERQKGETERSVSDRWLILIFYLIGLSIGVHLLCLLTIPAIVFVYFFKIHPFSFTRTVFIAGIVSVVLLGAIQAIIIPGIVHIAALFEHITQFLGMPSGTGVIYYALFIILLIISGLFITRKYNKYNLNTAILALCMLIIGYSSFIIIVIRSNAHTPIDENHPSDAVALNAYLGREQYGDWPLIYGQYYTAPLDTAIPFKDGKPNYDSRFCTFFPRMYDPFEGHPIGYKNWGDTTMDRILYVDKKGHKSIIEKPTFFDNIRYFIRYQVNFMFWKYFMWNFCGRQNDIQGYDSDDKLHGNWLTGVPFIDTLIGIPQHNIPAEYAQNKARNAMFGLPLLLGLLGFIYQFRKDMSNVLVVSIFFFFTGIAIVIYLNQTPYQPRERDYSYVGAFYAFAIWIGLGVLSIADFLNRLIFKRAKPKTSPIVATLIAMVVPLITVHSEWDDHDRSGHYLCRDIAIDYLESCAPNAILFCYGDNDTFPLWYAQEVEGIRTDIRVCNTSLLASSWYIDQMKCKTYNSAPLPISLTHAQYADGVRDYQQNYLPGGNFITDSITPSINFNVTGNYIDKNTMIFLDILNHDDWSRPIYFTTLYGISSYKGLEKYLQLEGLAYRLVPLKTSVNPIQIANSQIDTRIATDVMYNNVLNKFRWGNMGSKVYLDENSRRMAFQIRQNMGFLAQGLIEENKKDSALKILNLCIDSIPSENYPYDSPMVLITYCYYKLGEDAKANLLAKEMFDEGESKLRYFNTLSANPKNYYSYEKGQELLKLKNLTDITKEFHQENISNDFSLRLKSLTITQ